MSVISKDSMNRLIKDVKDLIKNPLHENGIYYKHDDTNMLKGYAMIIGPSDTPYFGGFYFFEVDFPVDYPHLPPKLTFCTNGYNIRLHPNFYKSGKVCLSLLNTWRGEQWTSCQSIKTVLLTIITLFTQDPLLHEPGVNVTHPDLGGYNDIIQFANIRIAICDIMLKKEGIYLPFFSLFETEYNEQFQKNQALILKLLNKKKRSKDITLKTTMYHISTFICYKELYDIFITITHPSV
jgi:ubiquitin-conjugating enzyme E2 Z